MAIHQVICWTLECENYGINLEMLGPFDAVMCGPCGQVITDITPPIPEYIAPESPENPEVVALQDRLKALEALLLPKT